ncbi:hypothetical protein L3Q72_16470 [Vibrio sp. JC009]|nr:hypothetical protein [Vibrio sp. JC009]WED24471.1 hypothetical protein L3Q72_16470 [Vibrio sp. JC009]
MGNDIGAVYVSNLVAKEMIHEALYGKPQKQKKQSSVKKFFKKLVK